MMTERLSVMEIANNVLRIVLDIGIILFEYMGLIIILFTGVNGFINFAKRDSLTRLKLAKGLALGLEFKLGAEILRTVLVRELSDIIIVGAIILLRAALAFLIHWELKNQESEYNLSESVRQMEEQLDEIKNQVHVIEEHERDLEVQVHNIEKHERDLEKQIHNIEMHERDLEVQVHNIEKHERDLEKQIHNIEMHERDLEDQIHSIERHERDLEDQIHSIEKHERDLEKQVQSIEEQVLEKK